jgi:hypothetical protein
VGAHSRCPYRRVGRELIALFAVAGIGAGDAIRRVVLARIGEAASWAQAEGAVSARRAEQIGRHLQRALESTDPGAAA